MKDLLRQWAGDLLDALARAAERRPVAAALVTLVLAWALVLLALAAGCAALGILHR